MAQKAFVRVSGIEDIERTLFLAGIEYQKPDSNEIYIRSKVTFFDNSENTTVTFEQNNKYILYEKIGNSQRIIVDYGGNWEIEFYLGSNYRISYHYQYLSIKKV